MDLPPPAVPPVDADDLGVMAPLCAVFRRFLKSRRLKYTPERADILDAIIRRDGLFEAEELMLDMRERGYTVSKATIYRTIKLLQEAGIITQALFDTRQAHYQLVYGRAAKDHMVCMQTGRRLEFSSAELTRLRDKICRELGWEPVGHRFQIYAISPDATDDADDADDNGDEVDELNAAGEEE